MSGSPNDIARIETITLELWRVYASRRISLQAALASNVQLTTFLDHQLNELVLTLRGAIGSQRCMDEINITYPADWWEAVKDRWLPAWAKRRWPVRLTRHHVDVRLVYPELVIPNQPFIKVPVWEQSQRLDFGPLEEDEQ
jgi:hypothetical protein